MRKRQRYTPEFRAERGTGPRVKGLEGNPVSMAGQAGRNVPLEEAGPVVDTPAITALKKEVDQLKIALADGTLESRFFKGALQSIEDRRRTSVSSGESASTDRLRSVNTCTNSIQVLRALTKFRIQVP